MKSGLVRTELFKIRTNLISHINTYIEVTGLQGVTPSPIINIDNFTAVVLVETDWVNYNDRESNSWYKMAMTAAPIGDLVTILEMFEKKAYERN